MVWPRRTQAVYKPLLIVAILYFAAIGLLEIMRKDPKTRHTKIQHQYKLYISNDKDYDAYDYNNPGVKRREEEEQEKEEEDYVTNPWIRDKSTHSPLQLGEGGQGVYMNYTNLSLGDKRSWDAGWRQHAFNDFVSQVISVRRSLRDIRPAECLALQYPQHLPNASVIIIFHDEAWSVLLRTIFSVLNRSPPQLLREIILVDDDSSSESLLTPLEDFLSENRTNIKLLRSRRRLGVVRARLMGARAARGDVLVFLDSHCECTQGWLEPLLYHINKSRSNVVAPVIHPIDPKTFRFNHLGTNIQLGGFNFDLKFIWIPIPHRDRKLIKSWAQPIRTPTMAGGLFAINRNYFKEIGTYDSGMDIWGSENLEISFRIWMCGGRLEIHPCSNVGHVFRDIIPYDVPSAYLKKNSIRLAEVWLDDFKDLYYERFNYNLGSYGDVSKRIALREKLNCRTFLWYIDNVYPELYVPSNYRASGEIRNRVRSFSNDSYCVDAKVGGEESKKDAVKVWPCHGNGEEQYWIWTRQQEIRRDEGCIEYDGWMLRVETCTGQKGQQLWTYVQEKGWLQHDVTYLCMQMSTDGPISMKPCNDDVEEQKWVWNLQQSKDPDELEDEDE